MGRLELGYLSSKLISVIFGSPFCTKSNSRDFFGIVQFSGANRHIHLATAFRDRVVEFDCRA